MDFEIVEMQNDISFEVPSVSFPAYEEYKKKAAVVADYINGMDVTPDNIKDTKETLAKARKLTDRLNRVRIDMKKEILTNYTIFESQVKEIVDIVNKADRQLRDKVNALEEIEREKKKEEIREIWDKRILITPELEKLIPDAFSRWLSPAHLNKTASMKSVETSMTDWIRETTTEIRAAERMGEEYLTEYISCMDLANAIQRVENRKKISEVIQKTNEPEEEIVKAIFIVYGNKDINLTERLLKENEIDYRREE